jgi:hypothetical protein
MVRLTVSISSDSGLEHRRSAQSSMMPRRMAMVTACVRHEARSFSNSFLAWTFTVCSEIKNFLAMVP